jgi:hypothetical protein
MTPAVRKLVLTVHLTCSVGWIGAVMAYLALAISATTARGTQDERAAWTALEVAGWWAIVPLALAALATGVIMSLGTRWGLFRHYWVLMSLALTVLCTVVLLEHLLAVSAMSATIGAGGGEMRADLFHPGVGLIILLGIAVLNVYKPRGLTRYGWRKHQEERARPVRRASAGLSADLIPQLAADRRDD